MRILIVGDTHGSTSAIESAHHIAAEQGCDAVFVVGDFGFYPADKQGQRFLKYCNGLFEKFGMRLYFLGGNHEGWNDLDTVHIGAPRDQDGFCIYGEMRIAPRSNTWAWGGMNFANMSGAFSIDRKHRVKGISWFPQELPSYDDADKLFDMIYDLDVEHVDVMLSHDAPVNLYSHQGQHHMVFDHAEAYFSQAVMSHVVETLKPSLLIHGHWHMFYRYFFDHTYCVGLDQSTGPSHPVWCTLLDTETRNLEAPYVTWETLFEIP